jgi:Tfp pilus assembly protein PilW
MVCHRTLTNNARRAAAFTLVEYMFAVAIGVLVLGTGVVLWGYASKTSVTLWSYADLSMRSKMASDLVSQKIRNAVAVKSFSSTDLVLLVPSATQTNGYDTVTFAYSPTDKTLIQTVVSPANATEAKTLLTECSGFEFRVYQKVPQSGVDTLTVAAGTNTAKVVEMRWTAGRQLTGEKTNMTSVVSSKVVMRSKF